MAIMVVGTAADAERVRTLMRTPKAPSSPSDVFNRARERCGAGESGPTSSLSALDAYYPKQSASQEPLTDEQIWAIVVNIANKRMRPVSSYNAQIRQDGIRGAADLISGFLRNHAWDQITPPNTIQPVHLAIYSKMPILLRILDERGIIARVPRVHLNHLLGLAIQQRLSLDSIKRLTRNSARNSDALEGAYNYRDPLERFTIAHHIIQHGLSSLTEPSKAEDIVPPEKIREPGMRDVDVSEIQARIQERLEPPMVLAITFGDLEGVRMLWEMGVRIELAHLNSRELAETRQ